MKEERFLPELEPETYPDRRIKLILDNMGIKHSVAFRPWVLILLVLLLVLGLALLGFFAFQGQNSELSSRLRRLETENDYLREKLDLYETELDSINVRLDTLGVYRKEAATAYPHFGKQDPLAPNRLQVNPGLGRKLDSIELKLATLKQQVEFGSSDVGLSFILPEEFDTHGDGIPAIHPTFGQLTDGWGHRYHPITLEFEYHYGLDIANRVGTPIYATADGIVSRAQNVNGYGKMITIEHTDGYQTLYGHLYSFKVRPGDLVCKGQIIGLMGNTGLSTGPHLHYAVSRNGRQLNPTVYLNRIDTNTYAAR
ncbi:MAG: M23 family metallopeptidase [Candidatus Syntrophosphaera sp.]|nr:M23 family metallopeptidase [Candidatus Syntrophosphaera sp.]